MTSSKKQTGPKTLQGKAHSSRNATKHGLGSRQVLLPHESKDEFMLHQELIHQEFPIKCPEQQYLVEQIAFLRWQQQRNQTIMEELCLAAFQQPIKNSDVDDYLGRIKTHGKSVIDIMRYGDSYVKTDGVLQYEAQQKIIEGVDLCQRAQAGCMVSAAAMMKVLKAYAEDVLQALAAAKGVGIQAYLDAGIDPIDFSEIMKKLEKLKNDAQRYCVDHEEDGWVAHAIQSIRMERVMAVQSNPNYERHLVRINRELEKVTHLYYKYEQRYIGQLPQGGAELFSNGLACLSTTMV
jgi:hypothetical protein